MTDNITALITEARKPQGAFAQANMLSALADALEAEHKRAEKAELMAVGFRKKWWNELADRDRYRAEAESARKTGERILADALRYRAAIEGAVSYIDGHWLAPFRPGETAHELRAILTRALNEEETDA